MKKGNEKVEKSEYVLSDKPREDGQICQKHLEEEGKSTQGQVCAKLVPA